MKHKTRILALLACTSGFAQASDLYNGYQAFFAQQPGQVFPSPVSDDYLPTMFDAHGVPQSSWNGRIGKQNVALIVSDSALRINGQRYAYSNSIRLPSDDRVSLDSRSVTLYVNQNSTGAGPLLCLESTGSGSGSADRYAQVYVVNQSPSKTMLLKLPPLFGSCRGLLDAQAGIQFPVFSYKRTSDMTDPTGTDVQYYSVIDGHYVLTSRRFSTRFVEPGNAFKFEVE